MLNRFVKRTQAESDTPAPTYVGVPTHDALLQLSPAFVRSLAHELAVLGLQGRVCPCLLSTSPSPRD